MIKLWDETDKLIKSVSKSTVFSKGCFSEPPPSSHIDRLRCDGRGCDYCSPDLLRKSPGKCSERQATCHRSRHLWYRLIAYLSWISSFRNPPNRLSDRLLYHLHANNNCSFKGCQSELSFQVRCSEIPFLFQDAFQIVIGLLVALIYVAVTLISLAVGIFGKQANNSIIWLVTFSRRFLQNAVHSFVRGIRRRRVAVLLSTARLLHIPHRFHTSYRSHRRQMLLL